MSDFSLTLFSHVCPMNYNHNLSFKKTISFSFLLFLLPSKANQICDITTKLQLGL